MNQRGVLLLLLDGMLVHRKLPPRISSGCPDSLPVPTHIPVEKHCAQKHNTMTPAESPTQTSVPESSALTIPGAAEHFSKLGGGLTIGLKWGWGRGRRDSSLRIKSIFF